MPYLIVLLAFGLTSGCAIKSDSDPEDVSSDGVIASDGRLGTYCGITTTCRPGDTDWPDCANAQCATGGCILTFGEVGYCGLGCDQSSQCRASRASIVGSDFQCVEGLCLPGSQSVCNQDEDCSGGEVCKVGLSGSSLITTCQSSTAGGATTGEPCNVDPVKGPLMPCANDICLGGVCSAFCSASTGIGCSANLECAAQVELGAGLSRDLCLGGPCTSTASCPGEGWACQPDVDGGRCVLTVDTRDAKAVGEPCSDALECRSAGCQEIDGESTCSLVCGSDAECTANGGSGLCAALFFASGNADVALPMCQPYGGTRAGCTGTPSCASGEVCTPLVTVSEVRDGGRSITGSVELACLESRAPQGAADGESCSSAGSCKSALCLSFDGSFRCTSPCLTGADCTSGTCVPTPVALFDQNTSDPGDDMVITVCAP